VLTIDAVISESLKSGVSKVGAGTLLLKQANTYTGTTFINNGSVRIQDVDALDRRPPRRFSASPSAA